MTQQLFDEYLPGRSRRRHGLCHRAERGNKDMFAAGANVVQLDEPFLQAYPEKARAFGVAAINRAVEGINGTTAVHLCFGYGSM